MAMVDPFVGQISIVSFNWAPVDWARCDGQVIAISQNATLYSLLGTTFGGNGQSTFAYPELRGRTPVGWNPGIQNLGTFGGLQDVVLTEQNMPSHTHALGATDANGDTPLPSGNAFAIANLQSGNNASFYSSVASNLVQLNTSALPTSSGGSQAHNNMQPGQVLNFVLCVSGLYPPRN